MIDVFRPHTGPAQTLYDVFQKEAELRDGRAVEEWQRYETLAVWRAARDYAQQHGLRVPLLDEVRRASDSAAGHVDYGSKWAYRVAELMRMKT